MAGSAPSPTLGTHPRLFSALHIRDFRQLWFSTLSIGSGQQMEILALGWYLLEQTDSAVLVGLIGAARLWGMFFAPFAGVLADRMSRRTLLLIVQGIVLTGSFLILTLSLAGLLPTWLVFGITTIAGFARSFDNLTRQTLIGDLAPKNQLTNAVALNQAAMNGSAVFAPFIAGVLFGVGGIAACFTVIATLNFIGVLATTGIRPLPVRDGATLHSPLRNLIDGAKYVKGNGVIAALMAIAAIANLCGFPLGFAMMPSFARDVLGVGSVGLGTLLSAVGFGALLGSLGLGTLGRVRAKGKGALLAMTAWMICISLVAAVPWFPAALVLLTLAGVCQSLAMSLVATLILEITPEELRGRVMGVRMLAIAPLPVGSALAGWLIESIGVQSTLWMYAGAGILLILATAALSPGLLRQD